MMIKIWLMLALLSTSAMSSIADESHTGHSDALLILLQYKLKIIKLQDQLATEDVSKTVQNLSKQQFLLNKALPILNGYMATPEGHYPNLQMYQQSLQSRSALLQDFNGLIQTHFQALLKFKNP